MVYRIGKRLLAVNVLRRQSLNKAAANCLLYPGQHLLLKTVINTPGITQQQAAQALCVTPASVAQSVKRLQDAGLIRRQVDAENRRCNRLYVTEQGVEQAKVFKRIMEEVDALTFAGFTPEECQLLEKMFDRMISNLSDEDTKLHDFPFWKEEDK